MLRKLIQAFAQLYKGPTYVLDSQLPTAALIGVAMRRTAGLLRCVFRLVVFSFDPRDWIFLEAGVRLRNRKLIHFGRGVSLGRQVLIDGLSRRGVTIGNRVAIGPFTIIEATGVITNLGEGCSIGDDSGLGAFSFIGAAGGVWIGKNVIMGQRISFHSENHVAVSTDIPIRLQGVTRLGIVIEDDCWVGANVTFLDGAHVESGCVIAAGSVVRGRIPSYSIAAGIPARVIRSRKEEASGHNNVLSE